nr:putative zinc-binding metallopeptidase [uncultured Porphyromonas sp.]
MNRIPRRLRQLSLIALASLALSACKGADSDLSKESVVRTPEHQSELDKYIEEQFSRPYNIEVLYR